MAKSKYLDLLAKYKVDGAHPGGFELTKKLLNRENIDSGTVLLDVGCGTGQTASFIAGHYPCQVIAVDINVNMLEEAARRFKRDHTSVDLMFADARQLPLPANSVDFVLAESVTVFTIIPQALQEYARVLKPGGTLIGVEITAETPLSPAELTEVRSVYGLAQVPAPEQWRQLLEQAGFSDIQMTRGKMVPVAGLASLKLRLALSVHLNLLKIFHKKIGYRVFRCRKA